MALDVKGKEFLVGAILCGVILLAAQLMSFPLGILGTILTVVIVVLLIAWILKLTDII